MSKKEIAALKAEKRTVGSKGAVRLLRLSNKVPASVYGDKKEPISITVQVQELDKQRRKEGFYTQLIELDIDGKKEKVLARLVQVHPVTDRPLHVDFLRVGPESKIRINVPFQFINQEKSTGIKFGGILNIVHHQIELSCRTDAIPTHIEVDVGAMEVGDSIRLDTIKLPSGAKPVKAENITIVTVVPPQTDDNAKNAGESGAGAEAKSAGK